MVSLICSAFTKHCGLCPDCKTRPLELTRMNLVHRSPTTVCYSLWCTGVPSGCLAVLVPSCTPGLTGRGPCPSPFGPLGATGLGDAIAWGRLKVKLGFERTGVCGCQVPEGPLWPPRAHATIPGRMEGRAERRRCADGHMSGGPVSCGGLGSKGSLFPSELTTRCSPHRSSPWGAKKSRPRTWCGNYSWRPRSTGSRRRGRTCRACTGGQASPAGAAPTLPGAPQPPLHSRAAVT